jgi:Fe2+ transport system protein FeoA
MEMGFVDKARIRVLSRSDSGIIANVNGTKLALSMELARQIIVTC